jgi:predicted transcriptional regulator
VYIFVSDLAMGGYTGMSNREEKHTLISKHLILVLALILALIITEVLIFTLIKGAEVKDIMALTFGTFGTWIGAGAAYFFGRENMREATNSLLRMSGRTPTEILASTTLREMNPRAIPGTFNMDDKVEKLTDWFKKNIEGYFVLVVDKDGKYQNTLNEEAVYRFINNESETQSDKTYNEIKKAINDKNIQDIIEFIKSQKTKELQTLIEYAIPLNEETKATVANEKLEKENKKVAIVVDAQNRATGYITTSDIRRLLTKES